MQGWLLLKGGVGRSFRRLPGDHAFMGLPGLGIWGVGLTCMADSNILIAGSMGRHAGVSIDAHLT